MIQNQTKLKSPSRIRLLKNKSYLKNQVGKQLWLAYHLTNNQHRLTWKFKTLSKPSSYLTRLSLPISPKTESNPLFHTSIQKRSMKKLLNERSMNWQIEKGRENSTKKRSQIMWSGRGERSEMLEMLRRAESIVRESREGGVLIHSLSYKYFVREYKSLSLSSLVLSSLLSLSNKH